MIRDITIGQFFPGDSAVHRMDPRAKLLICFAFIVVLFSAKGAPAYVLCAAVVLSVLLISKISVKLILKSLKPVLFIVIFTALLNVFYTPGHILFQVWILRVTTEGLLTALYMGVRIVLLIMATSLLTYTTSPIALTDALERLLGPLKKIKVPVHEFSMMMTIALRFIPTLTEETDKIMSAQKARGADFESGNLMRRVKALIPVLVPLFVSAFRRADELATAMQCRLYNGGEGRTRLRQLRFAAVDLWGVMVSGLALGAIVAATVFFP